MPKQKQMEAQKEANQKQMDAEKEAQKKGCLCPFSPVIQQPSKKHFSTITFFVKKILCLIQKTNV